MKQHKLEIYVDRKLREAHCLICSPNFGDAGEFARGEIKQVATLNDGQNRVRVAVYNSALPMPFIQHLARIAVDGTYDRGI
jgi:hypothetical protein